MVPEKYLEPVAIVIGDGIAHALAGSEGVAPCCHPGQSVEYAGRRDGVEHLEIAEDRRKDRIDQAESLAGEEWTGA
jgi:hypothetical protein